MNEDFDLALDKTLPWTGAPIITDSDDVTSGGLLRTLAITGITGITVLGIAKASNKYFSDYAET